MSTAVNGVPERREHGLDLYLALITKKSRTQAPNGSPVE